MFLSGPKFCGVKMVPPGPHMLTYYAVASSPGGFSAPNVRWLYLSTSQVTVLRWNGEVELLDELTDEDEAGRYAQGVRRFDFDAGLAPYNLPAWPVWQEIAGRVTSDLIERIMPVS
jgi:A1 cistron-splicing factor AAR2